jgi:hypothetical protein
MTELSHNSIGHEADDADVRGIGLTGLALAIGIAIVLFLVYGLFQYLVRHPVVIVPASPLTESDKQQFPAMPRISEHPATELENLHSREDQILSTYGWVDKKTGMVRIPSDRAMELQLERGFPARKEGATK